MGLLSNLIEKRASDPEQLSRGWFLRWMGGGGQSEAGVMVNEATALNSILVVSCVRILAETLASLPLPVYQRLEPRGRERARNHPLYTVLHDEPNSYMSSFTFRERMMAHLALWGNHYSVIERDPRRNEVIALWPVHPRRVEVSTDDNGALRYKIEGTNREYYPAEDILHIPGLAMDGVVGLSPLSMMRQAVGLAVAAESYGSKFFANDARPSVLLKHPAQLSDMARTNLRDSWQEMHGEGRGGVGILEEGMSFETVGMPPQDAQFLETRRFQVQELARFYRIPPHLLADVERSTSWGTGIEQQTLGFVMFTMRPWLVRIEQELTRKLLRPQERSRFYVEFNIDGLLRGDMNARKEFYESGRQWGYLSANDILDMENRNPIENGDIYLQPMNMVEAGWEPPAPAAPVVEAAPDDDPEEGEQQDDPEQRSYAPEWRMDMTPRQRRSATARQRMAVTHQAVYRDAVSRLIRIEQQEVRAAIRRNLKERSVESFEAWVREFYYEKFPARIIDAMTAPVRSLMEAVALEAADEVGSDPLPEDELDTFARQYVETYSLRHAGDSRSRLLKLIHDAAETGERQKLELTDELEEELEEWDSRPQREAEDETHRGSNAIAKHVFVYFGATTLRWIAAGSDPCDYCQSLSGRTVGTDSAFLGAGQKLAPGGINPFVSESSIGHPPLHKGCACVIGTG